MHSIAFEVERGGSDLRVGSRPVKGGTIHHNGDWSGDVIIVLHDGKEGGGSVEVRVPGAAILRAAGAIVADALVNEAERRGDDLADRIISGKF